MKVLILSLLFAIASTAVATPIWILCKDVKANTTITEVDVEGCTAPPCMLKKGTNATVTIGYTLGADEKAVYNQVYGIIAGIHVPFPNFPADQANACTLGMTCPGKSGDKVVEKVSLPVSTSDPSIKVVAEWKLTSDSDGKDVLACFEAELQITS